MRHSSWASKSRCSRRAIIWPGLHPAAGVDSEIFEPAGDLWADRRLAIGNDVPGCGQDFDPGAATTQWCPRDFNFGHSGRAPHSVTDQHRRGDQYQRRAQKDDSQASPPAGFFIVIAVDSKG